jgi:F-type H+-transporting ATPase subunit b
MEIVSNIAMISINATLFIQVGSFLVFMLIMNRIMFKPLRGTVSEREDYLDNIKKEIITAEKELELASKKLQKSESAAKKEAFSVRETLEKEGNDKANEIFEAAKLEIQKMREIAEKQVESQIQEARSALNREAESFVVAIMEKVLGRKVSS